MDYGKARRNGTFTLYGLLVLQAIFNNYEFNDSQLYNFLYDGNRGESDADLQYEASKVEEFMDVLEEVIKSTK